MKSPRVIITGLIALLATLAWVPQASSAPLEPPTFTNATVHDPDHIYVAGTHYFFGSHLQVAASDDLMSFNQVAEGVTPANPLFEDVTQELAEALEWAESDTLWAPDIIQLDDGRFYMYYNACRGDSPRSAMGVAVADEITGPYTDLGVFLKSGMWDQISEDGTIYDARVHPNVVDPDVFLDEDGRLWMVYGSFSGGIFILELDPGTGFPYPDQGYGKHLWGGNHARVEGAAVHWDEEQGYYYMFVTYGGLDSTGGYNIRVARAEQPDGPYLDASGRNMAEVKADPSLPLFDDASIADSAVKLAGNHQFTRELGAPGSGSGTGYVSPGGSTVFPHPETDELMIGFHTRFPGGGETHQIRVHQLIPDVDGWPVLAPFRYGGGALTQPTADQLSGAYAVVDHAPRDITAEIHASEQVILDEDGTIRGERSGTWSGTASAAELTLDGAAYTGVFTTQWHPDRQAWVPTFTGLSPDGAALWAAQIEQLGPEEAVAAVIAELSLPSETITSLTLPTSGVAGTTIVWDSSDPTVIAADGTVQRPATEPATVVLTATVTNGAAQDSATFTVDVPAQQEGAVIGAYNFDDDLTGTNGLPAATVSGPFIDATGGQISFIEGVRGSAAHLDGQSGLRLPDGLLSGPTYSVSLWLKPETTSEFTTAFFAARDADNWVSLLPQGHGGVGGQTMIWSGTQWYDAGIGSRIPLDEWSHLAFTVDTGDLTVWLNGERVVERDGFPDVLTTQTGIFSLGVNWWDTAYQGAIDELELRTSALTDADVAALMALDEETEEPEPGQTEQPDPGETATADPGATQTPQPTSSPTPSASETPNPPQPTPATSPGPARPGLPGSGA